MGRESLIIKFHFLSAIQCFFPYHITDYTNPIATVYVDMLILH